MVTSFSLNLYPSGHVWSNFSGQKQLTTCQKCFWLLIQVFYGGFVLIRASPALLRDAYERRYTIVCKPGRSRKIRSSPLLFRHRYCDGSAIFTPEDQDFSGILMRVKNRQDVFYLSHREQCNNMMGMFSKFAVYSILVQVGKGGMGAIKPPWNSQYPTQYLPCVEFHRSKY